MNGRDVIMLVKEMIDYAEDPNHNKHEEIREILDELILRNSLDKEEYGYLLDILYEKKHLSEGIYLLSLLTKKQIFPKTKYPKPYVDLICEMIRQPEASHIDDETSAQMVSFCITSCPSVEICGSIVFSAIKNKFNKTTNLLLTLLYIRDDILSIFRKCETKEDFNLVKNFLEYDGNGMEYLDKEVFYAFLDSFSKNSSISEDKIRTLSLANEVLSRNISVTNQENNEFCLEYSLEHDLLRQDQDIVFTDKMLAAVIEFNLFNCVNYILQNDTRLKLIHDNDFIKIMSHFAYHDKFDIKSSINWLIHNNVDEKSDHIVIGLFDKFISHPGHPELIQLLFDNFNKVIKNNYSEPSSLDKKISGITDPKIVHLLLKNGFIVPYDKIKNCFQIACIESDVVTKNNLLVYLNEDDRKDLWEYRYAATSTVQQNNQDKEKNTVAYGDQINQKLYRELQSRMSNMILASILQNGNFKLMPEGFNFGEYKTKSDLDQKQTEEMRTEGKYTDEKCIEEKYTNIILDQENSYPLQCNLFTLGAFRYWMDVASHDNNESDFGRYRINELSTACIEKYLDYFNRFIHKNYDQYKNTPCLKTYDKTDGSDMPNCQIYATINGKDIGLTKYYSRSNDHYAWVHVEADDAFIILKYCESLINNIILFEIKNHDNMDRLTAEMGQLHWWLAHACPFERGSASISEAICMALFKLHGFQVTWNSMPDCEALIMPSMEEYSKNYSSLLNIKKFDSRQEFTPLKEAGLFSINENRLSTDEKASKENENSQTQDPNGQGRFKK